MRTSNVSKCTEELQIRNSTLSRRGRRLQFLVEFYSILAKMEHLEQENRRLEDQISSLIYKSSAKQKDGTGTVARINRPPAFGSYTTTMQRNCVTNLWHKIKHVSRLQTSLPVTWKLRKCLEEELARMN